MKHLAVASLALVMAACVTSGTVDTSQKDISGRTMHLGDWQDIEPYQFRINIADLEQASMISQAREQMRDNTMVTQEAWFSEGRIRVEHHLSPNGAYNHKSTRSVNNLEDSRAWSRRGALKEGIRLKFDESIPIRKPLERGGWVHIVQNSNEEICVIGRVGFLSLKKRGLWSNEHYDSLVYIRDCSGEQALDQIVDFLTHAKIVKPEYNRAAMK